MTHWTPATVYLLCLAASVLCACLLARTYVKSRTPLLLWTAISFGFLALNNLLLVADDLVFLEINLWPYRQAALAAALAVLIYGFIWEAQ